MPLTPCLSCGKLNRHGSYCPRHQPVKTPSPTNRHGLSRRRESLRHENETSCTSDSWLVVKRSQRPPGFKRTHRPASAAPSAERCRRSAGLGRDSAAPAVAGFHRRFERPPHRHSDPPASESGDPGAHADPRRRVATRLATSTATPQRKLSPIERINLGRRIAVERAKRPPTPWNALARKEGMPSSTIRYLHANFQACSDELEDPMGLIDETLRLYHEIVELLSDEAVNGDSSSARVGAIRSLQDTLFARLSLLAAVGKLPRNLGSAQDHERMVETVEEMAQVLKRNNIPQVVIQELLEVVTPPTEATQQPLALTAGAPRRSP